MNTALPEQTEELKQAAPVKTTPYNHELSKDKFRSFLALNNLGMVFKIRRSIQEKTTEEQYLDKEEAQDFIMNAFKWKYCFEGQDFWENIHNKWMKELGAEYE